MLADGLSVLCINFRELCKRLDLETFLPGFQMMTSPTKEVLALYEVCEKKKIHNLIVQVLVWLLQDESSYSS